MEVKCIDCHQVLKNYRAKRCISCNGVSKRGKNNPRWSGGEFRNICKDCGKKCNRRAIRCNSCSSKKIHTGMKRKPEFGILMSRLRKGANCNFWKGGKTIVSGYIYIHKRNHPNSNKGGYIAQHRLLMEKHIGRLLNKSEKVHHINGIRDDNRIDNLILFKNHSEHMKYHVKGGEIGWQKTNIQ